MAKGKKRFEIKTPRGTIYTQGAKAVRLRHVLSGIRDLRRAWKKVSKMPRRLWILNVSVG